MTEPAIGGIQSTAGAIPVRNKKGELTMQKVKVHRYISGKRPDYAPDTSSEEESDHEDFIQTQKGKRSREEENERISVDVVQDRRLERLKRNEQEKSDEEEDDEDDIAARRQRRRAMVEPEVLEGSSSEDEKMEASSSMGKVVIPGDAMESDEDDEVNEEDLERRRALIRQKLLSKRAPQEEVEILMDVDEIKQEESSEDTSEYEEYTDSEEEDLGPRLKPVFVRKRDRLTVAEKEKLAEKERLAEIEARRAAEERKRQSIKMVEEEIRKENASKKSTGATEGAKIDDVCTDDENDELEYEAWKIRELKRVKRDKDEKEQLEKERIEIDRLRNMTEEQRRQELRNRPKLITNKAVKGKYKFLQKYFHRGAFYLDEDDEVYKRDFSGATLEDHFDKSVLPKVMQVKNFGRSGRTKYTHLVDQDTTAFDSPWSQENTSRLGSLKSTAGTSSSRN